MNPDQVTMHDLISILTKNFHSSITITRPSLNGWRVEDSAGNSVYDTSLIQALLRLVTLPAPGVDDGR